MYRRLFAALFVLAMVLITVTPTRAITGGEPDGTAHPYVGLVALYDAKGNYIGRCSGTLLSPTVVLTAGHCTYDAASARVYFDPEVTVNLQEPGDTGVVGEPYAHPDFGLAFPNTSDVGIVVLSQPVIMETYGELPELGVLDSFATRRGKQDLTVTNVGYGIQDLHPELVALKVRYQATAKVINLNSAYTDGYNVKTSHNMGHGGGTCNGDSGGPVFLGDTNIIIAITSFGPVSCMGVDYAYRVDIENSLEFIDEFL